MAKPPSFDEWLEYSFSLGYRDWCDERGPGSWRLRQFLERLDIPLRATYLTRLCESPSFIATQFDDSQIGEAVWFLFMFGSEHIETILADGDVPPDAQARLVRSIETLFVELFDKVCGDRGADPWGEYIHTHGVDMAVYMLWGMLLVSHIFGSREREYLRVPAFESLEGILRRCNSASCHVGALHGLGHIHDYAPKTVEAIIDRATNRRGLAPWVRNYARDARRGAVQ